MNLLQGFSNVGLNIANSTATSALVNNELNFIKKYGNTTASYDKLDQLGNIKTNNVFILIFILAIVLCIVSFIFASKTSSSVEPTLLNKILYYFGWICVIVIITMIGYGGYFYLFLYLPQYTAWLRQLSPDAQNDLATIHALSDIVNRTKQQQNQRR
jgi:hypothetical protein